MLASHFGAVSFGVARLGDVPGAPAPVTPDQITAPPEGSFPVAVYQVQCALVRHVQNVTLSIDGRWGPKTDAAMHLFLASTPRPTTGTLFYDAPQTGSTTVNMSSALMVRLLEGVTYADCPAPAGIIPSEAPAETAAPRSPPVTLSPETSMVRPVLIGLAALTVLGGLGWVLWRRRGRLKSRLKG